SPPRHCCGATSGRRPPAPLAAAPGSVRSTSSGRVTAAPSARSHRAPSNPPPAPPERGGTPKVPEYDCPIDDPALYFNRELSWLDFNQRVLELAEEAETPLLERARF